MQPTTNSLIKKIAVLLGFAGMVAVNTLAMLGKINGINTADVSALYPTLFTPAGYTFSIWGTIYLLLLIYVVIQLISRDFGAGSKPSKIALWFVLSCVANAGWIFAWHYGQIAGSLLLMIALMICLSNILVLVKGAGDTFRSVVGLELPFGLYAGWITVATVANVSVFLADLGWDGFGVPAVWLIAVLLIAAAVALLAAQNTRNLAYPAAVIWGFGGVLARYAPHLRFDTGSDQLWIALTLVVSMLALAAHWITLIVRRVR